ncbi:MAG: LolA-like outer membrane lipoprotein chaperone [Sulfurimonas sp.]
MKQILVLLALSSLLTASSITLPDHFTAKFRQKITNPDKKVIHYRGTVRFSDKKMLKWEYQIPTHKEVCSNGKNLTIVDHELEQVSFYVTGQGVDLAKILAKATPYKETKTVFLAKYEGKQYTLQVDGKGQLSRVAYYDDLENEVLIVFEEMKYGRGSLPIETMLCRAPEAYDRIEE